MPAPAVAFVGFGEVAAAFSAAMRARGAAVAAYDHNLERPGGRARLEARATGVRLAPLAEALGGAELVLSTVRPQTAPDAARACAAHLRPGQLFVDLNTTSPAVKAEIGRTVAASGAAFAEGAVLGAVGAAGAAAAILTGGPDGERAARALRAVGLNARFYSPELGKASTFKLLRGIFTKGAEALLLELLRAGRKAGMERELWEDLADFMSRHPFEKVATNWILTHLPACARRHHELERTLESMRALGAEPIMTVATEAFFRRSAGMDLGRPASREAVVEALDGGRP
jgi:3-hydroxyisobutyrate dehydrogenase-like beta-hydroxyacid dehydrogenase